ncbi:ER-Golgi trafficking TRAPP I complex 85 kDa subunit [Rhizoctonia solani]|uniref:ER-Golgi trafficking TRAPP I complex 85 kDa subunit n=1 Tax=Rhizoctonia solani TaxID=456999 RepID=A0A8H7IMF9_9AGAM|nr:ER-Golgi trafficking TRAPP I complex 85 kDa subunit [Rhizoctonia solani]
MDRDDPFVTFIRNVSGGFIVPAGAVPRSYVSRDGFLVEVKAIRSSSYITMKFTAPPSLDRRAIIALIPRESWGSVDTAVKLTDEDVRQSVIRTIRASKDLQMGVRVTGSRCASGDDYSCGDALGDFTGSRLSLLVQIQLTNLGVHPTLKIARYPPGQTGIKLAKIWNKPMSSALPFSLSPHVVVLASPDLVELLADKKLPQLPDLLRSFTPLESISARTTALATTTHDRYFLRFSDLLDVETVCKEDEEARAGRMFDWISSRVSKRAAAWVREIEERPLNLAKEMKWWEDIRLCTEGDIAPARTEGWNHPVALILATSTMASNPLQAITNLHSRALDFPPWVDPVLLKFTLIIHPISFSPLNMDESQALFNAVKKQQGAHTHLMCWSLSGSSSLNPFIPPPPRLPPPPNDITETPSSHPEDMAEEHNRGSIALADDDLETIGRFVREFVTQSLIPWMERNVIEWNEAYVATRRLPSRLFSTTRRLFGTSGSSTPAPSSPSSPAPSTAVQQRRLAEFATFLGDLKLATTVFDTLRKDTSNASAADVLPLLLTPSRMLETYAHNALLGARLIGKDPSPSSQLRALKYAVRWERGIRELNAIGGDQWLMWAAGSSEEVPTALLLAQAAQLCARKGSSRRATLCYVAAAERLDKCGIKPLTMHFLRLARDLCNTPVQKLLSPAFFEAEDNTRCGFDGISSGIDHALGRLKYTTGDAEGAVKTFISLLHPASAKEATKGDDETYIEDFKVALEHLISTSGHEVISQLALPVRFCQPQKTQIRVGTLDLTKTPRSGISLKRVGRGTGNLTDNAFCVVRGLLKPKMFWVELSVYNPLDAEVTLSDLTLTIDALDGIKVAIESLSEVGLRPKETRLLHMGLTCQSPGTITISHITYRFLSLLPTTEPLTWRGARLHTTHSSGKAKCTAPIMLSRTAAEGDNAPGTSDCRGSTEPLTDIWVVMGEAGWPFLPQCSQIIKMKMTSLEKLTGSPLLGLGKHLDLQVAYCGHEPGLHDISILLVFRKENDETFYTTRMKIPFHVEKSLQTVAHVQPSADIKSVHIPSWSRSTMRGLKMCKSLGSQPLPSHGVYKPRHQPNGMLFTCSLARTLVFTKHTHLRGIRVSSAPLSIPPGQLGRTSAVILPQGKPRIEQAIETNAFTARQLRNVLEEVSPGPREAPLSIELSWSHIESPPKVLPLIPSTRAENLVPLFGAHDLDVILEYNSGDIRGFLFAHGLQVGGLHGGLMQEQDLDDIQGAASNGVKKKKKGRSMYAETEREREMLASQIRGSMWNASGPCISAYVCGPGTEVVVQEGNHALLIHRIRTEIPILYLP